MRIFSKNPSRSVALSQLASAFFYDEELERFAGESLVPSLARPISGRKNRAGSCSEGLPDDYKDIDSLLFLTEGDNTRDATPGGSSSYEEDAATTFLISLELGPFV